MFKSDSTKNYEVGLRTDLFDKTFSIDMAVFYIDWKDIQILSIVQTPTGPVGINGNSGSATSKGVEWNFRGGRSSGLTLGLLGSYTDAYLTADAPGLGAISGEKLPYVPEVSNTLNVDYKWPAFGELVGIRRRLGDLHRQPLYRILAIRHTSSNRTSSCRCTTPSSCSSAWTMGTTTRSCTAITSERDGHS